MMLGTDRTKGRERVGGMKEDGSTTSVSRILGHCRKTVSIEQVKIILVFTFL